MALSIPQFQLDHVVDKAVRVIRLLAGRSRASVPGDPG